MLRWLAFACCFVLVGPLQAQGIADVLDRSQAQHLESLPCSDMTSPRTRSVQASFDELVRRLALDRPAELHVVSAGVLAETLRGHIVVVNEALADLPEGERLFVIAHELGHVALGHGSQMRLLYQKYVPGRVAPETTDPVAALLGRDASALAHQQEYEADAFALDALRRLGRPVELAFSAFTHLGSRGETPTHPSTRRRVAALRAQAGRLDD